MSKKQEAILRKAKQAQEEFLTELQELLTYSEPKEIINTIDSVYLDWLTSSYADDNTYRTDVTNVFRSMVAIIKTFDQSPTIAAQTFKNLQINQHAVQK